MCFVHILFAFKLRLKDNRSPTELKSQTACIGVCYSEVYNTLITHVCYLYKLFHVFTLKIVRNLLFFFFYLS